MKSLNFYFSVIEVKNFDLMTLITIFAFAKSSIESHEIKTVYFNDTELKLIGLMTYLNTSFCLSQTVIKLLSDYCLPVFH